MAVDGLVVDHVGVVPLQDRAQLYRASVRIFRDPAAADLGGAMISRWCYHFKVVLSFQGDAFRIKVRPVVPCPVEVHLAARERN